MKIGMMLGFEDSIKTITQIAREAEQAGIHTVYTVDAGRSATITAAAVINATQRARVGTYIVNAYARAPWMTGLESEISMNAASLCAQVKLTSTSFTWASTLKAKAKMRDFIEPGLVVRGRAAERVHTEART